MNLSSQDRLNRANYETSCKNCIFADWADYVQTGCTADRLKNFDQIAAYDEEKQFCVIDTICTYYRPKTWNNGVPSVTKAEDECTPSVTIIFYIKDDSLETIESLCWNISYISECYSLKKVQVILTHNETVKPSNISKVTKLLDWLNISYCGVGTFSYNPEYIGEIEVFKKVKGVFVHRVKDLDSFDLRHMDEINHVLNINGERIIFFDTDCGEYVMSAALKSFKYGDVSRFFKDLKEHSISKGFYKKL